MKLNCIGKRRRALNGSKKRYSLKGIDDETLKLGEELYTP